ncbi:MAG: hypothetical protein AAFO81_13225 [Pseudomonadota bacterium]
MRLLPAIIATVVCHSAAAQDSPAPSAEDQSAPIEEIIVRGQAQQGVTLGAKEPDLVLTESDIAAYGVSTIGELLQAIAAESASDSSRRETPPVVLLNGRRISGFREIGRYPVESVSRVEVLSEEVSLSYGFSPNQRVINFILKDNVRILAVDARARTPEAGGSTEVGLSTQRLKINGDTRLGFDLSLSERPAILESERRVSSNPDGDITDRAILGDLESWSIGTSLSLAALTDAVATGSSSFERSVLSTLVGGDGLRQDQTTDRLNVGLSLNGPLAPTIWGLTANHQNAKQTTALFGDVNSAMPQRIRQRQSTTRLDGVVNTQIAQGWLSPLAITLNAGIARERQDNDRVIDDAAGTFGRDVLELGMTADVAQLQPPLLPGELSVNANVALRRLSDIGSLSSAGFGIAWRINDYLQWDFAYNEEAGAPELAALSAPLVTLPNARVFDTTTGANSLAAIVEGGNPALVDDSRQVVRWGARLYPLATNDLTLAIDYTTSRIANETRQFDLLTREFEIAFPERVERAVDGTLIRFDRRPVRTTRTDQQNLRTSVSWSYRIPTKRRRATGPRPKRRLRSGRPGRLRVGLVHNWTLRDDIRLTPDSPLLDLLNGGATSAFGGTPEHTVDLTAYRWNEGLGSFVALSYRASTRVASPTSTLTFDDRVIINTRVSYEFNYSGALVARWPWLEETRLLFEVSNLLNDPVAVRNSNGATPPAFQADLLDPIERRFGIEIRKRF